MDVQLPIWWPPQNRGPGVLKEKKKWQQWTQWNLKQINWLQNNQNTIPHQGESLKSDAIKAQ